MTRLIFAPRAVQDMDRLTDFLMTRSPSAAAATTKILIEGLALLKQHPLIGRTVEAGLRELIISRGRSGYVALYRYNVQLDAALVLAIRHQREGAYQSADDESGGQNV